jgi:hypothetical protein
VAENAMWKHRDKNWHFMDENAAVIGSYWKSGYIQMAWYRFWIIC